MEKNQEECLLLTKQQKEQMLENTEQFHEEDLWDRKLRCQQKLKVQAESKCTKTTGRAVTQKLEDQMVMEFPKKVAQGAQFKDEQERLQGEKRRLPA
ncbi:Coiled-coil domain-containing protein 19, mitochondrial [Fukomys damarensis]|uniref:Coiled-coil domain-containing protein 19, mitochondrial n=1 Tax=Fukomys damarensis TaxID=885580 RepID=A0A091CQV9_FUKDA|nr:Coiled-coil domain-containing protein 19, mitochondrial [Fukomys damarensis]